MLKKYKIMSCCIILMLTITGCSNKLNDINSKEDLNYKNIGVYTGSEYDVIINENILDANIVYFNSYSDQISALKSGKIDGFLTDEPLAKQILKENEGLKILNNKLTTDSYAFAINPKKDNLKKDIDNVITEIEKNGKLKDFENKWMGNNENIKVLEKYNNKNLKGTIKFATVSGSAPFAYIKNNEIVGYDIDVINYIGYKLGYKIEIIEMSFDGIIPAIASGKVDMAGCSIIVTEERKKSVLFSKPDYTGGIVVVVRN